MKKKLPIIFITIAALAVVGMVTILFVEALSNKTEPEDFNPDAIVADIVGNVVFGNRFSYMEAEERFNAAIEKADRLEDQQALFTLELGKASFFFQNQQLRRSVELLEQLYARTSVASEEFQISMWMFDAHNTLGEIDLAKAILARADRDLFNRLGEEQQATISALLRDFDIDSPNRAPAEPEWEG